jgi:hypothetical protein
VPFLQPRLQHRILRHKPLAQPPAGRAALQFVVPSRGSLGQLFKYGKAGKCLQGFAYLYFQL